MTITATSFDESSTADVQDYFNLLKPRVMSLVVFTGLCGLLMAPDSIHPVLAFSAILSIAVGAGAAGCLNMWWDRDIDAIMNRTRKRGIPQGRVDPDSALAFGVILSFVSLITMGVAVHWLAAGLLALTILFYVFVYTMWLKRWTPQNIVIGGAAGAFPPVIGWAAVSGTVPLEAWILFGIIFLWTPPHFWALSLYSHEDYARANVPMLPVVSGVEATKRQIIFYTILLVALSVVPSFIGMSSWIYGIFAIVLGAGFLGLAWRVKCQDSPKVAMQLFAYSIFYLFALFLVMTVDRVLFVL
ncbi:MAG: heme o synthase [Alphaproteobacteria bacterium]|jgi:protoheme IX farnesyltransferase|nr:heme o synthase [Alphaproteobacteria bacterium]